MKALILAAGFGNRLAPITDAFPKPLVPVLNTPVIEYNINFLKYYGVKEIYINTHHQAEKLTSALGDGSRFGIKINWMHEPEILGTGGAIGKLKDLVNDDFIVINSDTIFNFNLENMIDLHQSGDALVTLGVIPSSIDDTRSVLTYNSENKVIRILDKSFFDPIPEGNCIFSGIHIINPKLLEYIPGNIYVSITNYVYCRMIENREKINAYKIDGSWWDMGTPESYFKCTLELLQQIPLPHFDPFEKYPLKPDDITAENLVVMGDNCKLPAVPVNPPTLIGKNVKIGATSQLGPNLFISDDIKIDSLDKMANAIYLPGSEGQRSIKTEKGNIFY